MGSSTLMFSFDTTFELLVAISGTLVVLSAFAIFGILLQIERTKGLTALLASSSSGKDAGSGTENTEEEDDLAFEESTSCYKQQDDESGKKVSSSSSSSPSRVNSPTSQKQRVEIEMSDMASSSDSPYAPAEPPISDESGGTAEEGGVGVDETATGIMKSSAKTLQRKMKRLTWSFIGIQIISVLSLILLTYLVLVVSNAAIPLRLLGSLCVFFIYLRFQIGDELRQQRIDRILLLVSLFLIIAGMLSLNIYSFKTLRQGEVYEGPARIVGYDSSQYNNSQHDPTTRTDIAVSWGKDWGCPMSGGKVCQARIAGAMCQVHPDESSTKHKSEGDARRQLEQQSRRRRKTQSSSQGGSTTSSSSSSSSSSSMSAAAPATESETKGPSSSTTSSTTEESEVDELEEDLEDEENAAQSLENENDSLKEQNAELEKEVEELKEENEVQEEAEEDLIDEADSDIYEVEEEYADEVMDLEGEEYADAEYYEDEIHEEKDKELEQKLNTTSDPDQQAEIEQEIDQNDADKEAIDEEYSEIAEEYEDYGDEYMDAADEEYDNALDAEDAYEADKDEEDDLADEVDETEATINKEKDNNNYSDGGTSISNSESEEWDDWYWDEYPSTYDDDMFEDEYWDYDWDSVWGEYACEDMFENELLSRAYDPTIPAGSDDDWPFVMIYGSCKTCEAYVLDYFAEEAFDEVEDLKQQAIIYSAMAVVGLAASFVAFLKYRVSPTPSNRVELLGYDGGVLA